MDASSRKILFISISVTLFTMAIFYYSFYTGRDIAERYTPLVDATMAIKLEATTAHLWFEEAISGDKTLDIEDIWANLNQSEWYAQAMLDGGINEEGTFLALNDPDLRLKIEATIDGIHHFRQIAQQRWASKSVSGIGSDLDQQFDLAFLSFNLSADNVESALQKIRAEDLQVFKLTQGLLIILIFILGIVIAALLLRFNTRQIKNINALKLIEEDVSNSQNQLQNVINGAKLGYWDWNYKTGVHIVNDEWLSILGLSRQDITNHISDWEGLIHPKDKQFLKKLTTVHIQSGKNYVAEFRMKHADGRWIWIQGSGSVVEYDENTHEPLRLCGTHQDISERKTAELREKSRTHVLELLTSSELLPVILEAIVRGVEQENPAMLCSILLLDDSGKRLVSGVAPSFPDFYNSAINGIEIGLGKGSCGTAAFINERVIVDDIQTHPYWTSYKELANKASLGACWSEPIRSTEAKVLGTFAIYHHDINQPTPSDIALIEQAAYLASIAIEQAQSNLALNSNELRFHQLLQSIPSVAVQSYDYEGNTRYWNKASESLYGYSADEAIGQSLFELIIPPAMRVNVRDGMQQMLKSKHPIPPGELTLMTKYGTEVNVYSSHAYVHVPGQSPEMFCIDVDLTERKLSEEKLKLAASVFTHARESIVITDAAGIILDVNDTFSHTTGYSREEAMGNNPRILQSGKQTPEFYVDMWQNLLKEGYWSGEIWNRRKNGEVYAEMKTVSAVRDEHGITTHYVALANDITPMKEHQNQLEHIAHYDLLTNLPNRSLLADRLSQAMLQCRRHKQSLAVVFLDLDGFKAVNDAYGHDMGDDLLVALSLRMKEALREGDSLARIGGDEFVAVLAGLTDSTTVQDCAPVLERLLLAASELVTIDNIALNVSASIGVTLYPQDNVDADLLMRHADQAMYVAKESGKNRYHLFDTVQDDAVKVQQESLEAIRSALDNHQFVLHYQPKVNMKTGTVIGVEALIRWQHPARGLLNPIEFLPVIENNPMSIEMGEWVIDTALTQISQWQSMGLKLPISTSVNIAAVQLQQPDFTGRLTRLLAKHTDVEPRYLELEVLETSALDDVHHISSIMNDCMALGVSFALDDFGTGYSSLTYLRRLPANLIKIDQSFVRDMLDDADDLAIIEGVIALAKSFKRDVIAEGVETIEHGTALLQLGCDLAQGYGIARPMPASDIPAWINEWRPDSHWQN
jgi:diguanylate cyclase (GGDEF)-like protein/PAS domain S-box-containing protein